MKESDKVDILKNLLYFVDNLKDSKIVISF